MVKTISKLKQYKYLFDLVIFGNINFITALIFWDKEANFKAKIRQKLNYLFGQAKGSPETIIRTTEMLRMLESVGIFDTDENRSYLLSYLENIFDNTNNIIKIQSDGRVIKDSFLMGKTGGLRMQTVWGKK